MTNQFSDKDAVAEEINLLTGSPRRSDATMSSTRSLLHGDTTKVDVVSEVRPLDSSNRYRKPKMRISKSVDYERLPQDDPGVSSPVVVKKRSQSAVFESKGDVMPPKSPNTSEKLAWKTPTGKKTTRPLSDGSMRGELRKSNSVRSSDMLQNGLPLTAEQFVSHDRKYDGRGGSMRERHPTKKLLRANSESAIQVNRLVRQQSLNIGRQRTGGIVCSNDDLKEIIKIAHHSKDGKRNKPSMSSIGRLMSMPEFTPMEKENISTRPKRPIFERVGRSAEAPAATGMTLSAPMFSSPSSSIRSQHSLPSQTSTIMNKTTPLTHVLTSSSNEHIFPNVIFEGSYENEDEGSVFELKPISEAVDAEPESKEEAACETTLIEKDTDAVDGGGGGGQFDFGALAGFDPELLGKAIEARLSEEIVQHSSDEDEQGRDAKKQNRSKKSWKSGELWVPNQDHQTGGSKWQSLLAKLNLRKKEDVSDTGVKL